MSCDYFTLARPARQQRSGTSAEISAGSELTAVTAPYNRQNERCRAEIGQKIGRCTPTSVPELLVAG